MLSQLYVTDSPVLLQKVVPVRNRLASAWNKPLGGLWTSTWHEERKESAWIVWCRAWDPVALEGKSWWLLSPDLHAHVCVINARSHFLQLLEHYGIERRSSRGRYLDFERLAQHYDALWLTEQGLDDVKNSGTSPDLLEWDCESTLWFRWCFVARKQVK